MPGEIDGNDILIREPTQVGRPSHMGTSAAMDKQDRKSNPFFDPIVLSVKNVGAEGHG